jgi:DNA-binding MarR family transcriptional regulator
MAGKGLRPSEYRALAEFRYQIRKFLHFSEQAARAAGLEPQHHQALLALKGLPEAVPPTIRSLAERLQLQHHSVVELIDRLAERGLVGRSRSEHDRREVFVHLTPLGDKLLQELSLHHRQELRMTGPALVRALETMIAI